MHSSSSRTASSGRSTTYVTIRQWGCPDGSRERSSVARSTQTSRSTSEVFDAYSIDHDFVRTRTVVRLFDIGVRFISRSEARRLLRGLERFREVLVDLRGVQEVGQ